MAVLERVLQYLAAFPEQTLLGVGDLMLDEYRRGKARQLSPEAPVADLYNPDLDERPGGAANVARNIGHLGGKVHLIGVVGRDEAARSLRALLSTTPGVESVTIEDAARRTTRKIRYYHNQFQVLRVSEESADALSPEIARRCQEALHARVDACGALFVEDYGKKLIDGALADFLLHVRASHPTLPIILDPKVSNRAVYRAGMCTLLKPNWAEACALAEVEPERAERSAVARALSDRYACDVLITLGPDGAFLSEREPQRALHVPTRPREAFDVAGAGDTTLAVIALALAAGASLVEAAILANAAGGVVVEKSGTAFVTPEELRAELQHPKTIELLSLLEREAVLETAAA